MHGGIDDSLKGDMDHTETAGYREREPGNGHMSAVFKLVDL